MELYTILLIIISFGFLVKNLDAKPRVGGGTKLKKSKNHIFISRRMFS